MIIFFFFFLTNLAGFGGWKMLFTFDFWLFEILWKLKIPMQFLKCKKRSSDFRWLHFHFNFHMMNFFFLRTNYVLTYIVHRLKRQYLVFRHPWPRFFLWPNLFGYKILFIYEYGQIFFLFDFKPKASEISSRIM